MYIRISGLRNVGRKSKKGRREFCNNENKEVQKKGWTGKSYF